MEAFKFKFTAKRLRTVPKRFLGFLIASGHCCNELVILMPYIVFEHELKGANSVETALILTRKFTVDRILISKIVEYGEMCSKFFKKAEKTDEELLRELSSRYSPIAGQIKSAKWARILRNKISFHYDPEHALDALQKLDDNYPLEFTAGRMKGVTLFDFAEEIVARPIFISAGKGDIGKGMEEADKFILELVSAITTFHANSTKRIFTQFGMVSEMATEELHDKYCAVPGQLRIPLAPTFEYMRTRQSRK